MWWCVAALSFVARATRATLAVVLARAVAMDDQPACSALRRAPMAAAPKCPRATMASARVLSAAKAGGRKSSGPSK